MENKLPTGEWVVNELSLTEDAFEILTSRPMENGMNGNMAYIKCSNYSKKGQAKAVAEVIAISPDLLKTVKDMLGIIAESEGIVGYHKNGEIAKWAEFNFVKNAEKLIKQLQG